MAPKLKQCAWLNEELPSAPYPEWNSRQVRARRSASGRFITREIERFGSLLRESSERFDSIIVDFTKRVIVPAFPARNRELNDSFRAIARKRRSRLSSGMHARSSRGWSMKRIIILDVSQRASAQFADGLSDADYARVSAEWNCFRLVSDKAPYNGVANDWIHARHGPRELEHAEREKIRRKNAADNRVCLMTRLESHGRYRFFQLIGRHRCTFSRAFPATFHAAISREIIPRSLSVSGGNFLYRDAAITAETGI